MRSRIFLLLYFSLPAACLSAEQQSPFIAGFERFARHGDIDARTAGRLLLTELSCTACHQTEDPALTAKKGPSLENAGSRIRPSWLRRFLMDPTGTSPGTTMPDMLHGLSVEQRRETVEALTAFLMSLEKPFPTYKGDGAHPVPHQFWRYGDAKSGSDLYHRLGCVACHAMDPGRETVGTKPSPLDTILSQLNTEELAAEGLAAAARRIPSVPLNGIPQKYTAKSLTHFLLAPHKARPASRMPDFQLEPVQAADISAWLRAEISDKPAQAPVSDGSPETIAAGRKFFINMGCAHCHDVKDTTASSKTVPLSQVRRTNASCLRNAQKRMPSYALDQKQEETLWTVIAAQNRVPSTVDTILLTFNCYACHERGGVGGVGRYRRPYFETRGHVDIGDEGRIPPPLSHVGSKLKITGLRQVLNGKSRIRPHLQARMPVFRSPAVATLADRLVETDLHDAPPMEATLFGDLSDLTDSGRQLLNIGCIQCHALNGETMPGVVGVELAGATSRLQPLWFDAFLRDPASLKPHTRMPSFFPNGRSQSLQILDGNTDRQIAAMWAYLKSGAVPLPDRLQKARSQSYELTPIDGPILLRTFMEQAGPHSLAVGWPQGIHYAFDAEDCRLAAVWKGRFLDAQGTWFVRFAPNATPLGTDVISFSPAPAFAVLKDPLTPWPPSVPNIVPEFRGYRLDRAGIPTLLYRVGGYDVQDRLVPHNATAFRRQLQIRPADNPIAGLRMLLQQTSPPTESSLATDIRGVPAEEYLSETVHEWRVPINHSMELEVVYTW